MTRSATRQFPLWQSSVGISAVIVLLNVLPRMSVTGKPLQLVTQTLPRNMYTADSRMAPAELRRGFPLAIEIVDGGEFITKEGHRRFAYSADSQPWIWQRISCVRLLINSLVTAIVGFTIVIATRMLNRRANRSCICPGARDDETGA